MKIILEGELSSAASIDVSRIVRRVIGERPGYDVNVVVARPGRAPWSVFVSGLPEHPLAVAIQAELINARL